MPAGDDGSENSLPRRLAWFVGLWAGGVAFVALIAYGIRFALGL